MLLVLPNSSTPNRDSKKEVFIGYADYTPSPVRGQDSTLLGKEGNKTS